ncbi:hypothetical protein HHK36_025886 [Tetracentron sinense]|uniref:Lipocalin/cytosolic fatty-acid binding domain-containing protein n=1 Tax=Tetracentron sinense TaxID=13715 RepID=A0A835D3F9_TETSI|nr:hypothetical protein HHK36_025886 [Tetracentron sinense]
MVAKAMKVVKGLDLQKYMGRWYEIASFPSRFQPKNGINTRATYTLRDDGTINVLNETWSDGKRGFIEGAANKADPSSDEAKLKVKFYVPPFLPIIPVVGDYWVLFIDHDYQYALIGQPSRKYLWVPSTSNSPSHVLPPLPLHYTRRIRTDHSAGTDTLLSGTPEAPSSPMVHQAPSEIVDPPLRQSIRIHPRLPAHATQHLQ